ncbi:MAG TPA: winged helix-turn-helix domain-containing protein [Nitrososphaera sp.]|nr:winged helix-turn-helix domain-containing protein [Nitrososphaera sp.]
MNQRGPFSILTLILQALQNRPLTKTRLMQTLMLNYKRVGYYCDFLLQKGLIEYDLRNHTYVITPRGLEVLRLNRELAGYLEPVDRIIKKYSYYTQGADLQQYASGINPSKPVLHHWQ